ncbi:hypothetical protein A2662_00940 [Candidatus Giovannonibacteria bacterium RIFCSPHIGHO2_01_FULL_45_33]|uniref:Ig-like domain-containing protein n=1 Tax=Candidatus Giovannonibacteria bacterium RIFCSPLOWO2_01_FULL_45_34 TaxID=1798351 RepID=A0A1F5WY17_9BACT|nr:MAG: hypothetical protein A2662_00940 [Candidatus Giovannonibacteria bacterium RIFCSPHIGHO2_01_FULL_45_33]OGF70879.1 MAG: hypothetical protein A3C73_02275 [Candidatus Giovannonibacteria bacterium RIFCSPHIGHO2_02_FULL_44_11]OGF80542.1 MAG: hypothetical protein A2930_02835 [Candidatus Giovannonibacteria bacterium RIFCSPLOWO2_01_FULL_45_34]
MKIFYKNSIIFLVLITVFASQNAGAAIDTKVADLSLASSPAYPSAGETFTVETKTYSTDAQRANYKWFLNGKAVASGLGITSQTFTAGPLGSSMKIDVSLTATDGRVFSKSLTIYIADVDIVLNPLTYTPQLYRGSSLASAAGTVEVYAVPHLFLSGARIAPQNLIYEWSLNGEKLRDQSGPGRNTMIFSLFDSGGTSYSIKVKVSSLSGAISAQKTASIQTAEPKLLFYEMNPLTGRAGNANVSFGVRGGGNISILAEPYFFDLFSLNRAVMSWNANGEKFEQPAGKNPLLLEITAPENAISLTNFSLNINDKKTIHQNTNGSFNIQATQ